MDTLIKQKRKRPIGLQEKTGDIGGTSGEKKIPPRKSVSFKEVLADKKSPNWFQKQFSRQMSGGGSDNDPISDLDHAAAVAAAAYAITSLEETWTQTHSGYELETTALRRPRSRREEVYPLQEPRRSLSRRLSGQFSFRESERKDDKPLEPKSPSMRKTPTFAVNFGGSDTKQTEDSERPTRTRSDRGVPPTPPPPPPPPLPPPPPTPREMKKQSSGRPLRSDDSAADAWEKTELAKIKERYAKLNRKIDTWEAKKKDKARRKLEKTERELEQRRKKALQRFREDMEYINQISGGARAQAEKQRQSEETKVKEKADVIRRTGQLPSKACLCF